MTEREMIDGMRSKVSRELSRSMLVGDIELSDGVTVDLETGEVKVYLSPTVKENVTGVTEVLPCGCVFVDGVKQPRDPCGPTNGAQHV